MIKKWITGLFLTTFAFVLYSGAAYAENLYVVSSGTNGAGTSWSSPWVGFNNIQWGAGTGLVGAGDTLYISGGITSSTYNKQLKIGASGAAGNPINIKIDHANSVHDGLVIIDLDKSSAKYGIDYGSNSYVIVDGYNPYQAGNIGIKVTDTDYSGVTMGANASNNTLRYVEQSYSTHDGIWLNRDGGSNLIEYCKAHDNPANYGHGILLQSGDNNTVSRCDSYDNMGSGFHTYAAAFDNPLNPANNETFQYVNGYRNGYALRDSLSHGIYIGGPSSNVTVTNSTFYLNGGAGIQFFAGSLDHASTGNTATNNISYDNGVTDDINFGWGIVVAGFNSSAVVQYNTLYSNKSHGLSIWDTASGTFTNNTIYNNGFGQSGTYGADGDYTGNNVSSSTINNNTYSDYSATTPLINWMGTVYSVSTSGTYQSVSGKDAGSTFTANGSPTPTPSPTPVATPTPTPTPVPSTGGYTVSYPAFSWTNATTTTTFSDIDEGYALITMPFDFTFFGNTYDAGSTMKAFVNGGISFDFAYSNLTATASYTTSWPNDSFSQKRMIAPWYQDMYSPVVRPAVLYTAVTGTSPNRVFVIAWKDMADALGHSQVFEAKLFETTNVIEFHYQTLDFTRAHVPGINNGTGNQGFQIADANLGNSKAVRFTPPTPAPTPTPTPAPTPQNNYTVSYPATGVWINATTGVNLIDGGYGYTIGDEGIANIALPFAFNFYGVNYPSGTTMKVFQNGSLTFDTVNTALTYGNLTGAAWPSSSNNFQKVIAPWYADTYNPAAEPKKLYTETVGTAPYRQFVIAWNDCQDANGNVLKFEVIFNETSDKIDFQYQTVNFARTHVPGLNKGDGIKGIQITDTYLGNNKAIRFTPN